MSSETLLPPLQPGALRPTERVQLFFDDYLRKHAGSDRVRLPTIKEISKHLDVSNSTVQLVVSQLTKDGRLETTQGKGTFIVQKQSQCEETPPNHSALPSITVSIHRNELLGKQSTWGKEICAGIFHGVSDGPQRVTVHPYFVDTEGDDREKIGSEAENSSVLIAFPSLRSGNLVEAFEKQGKPIIHITVPDISVAHNFVSPNFYTIAQQIARVWLQTGRRNIVALLHQSLLESPISLYSHAGLKSVLHPESQGNEAPSLSHYCLEIGDYPALEALFSRLADEGNLPDAIYSTSDTIAADAVRFLTKRGIRVPDQVSIIGGTGLPGSAACSLPLTVTEQHFEQIGTLAAQMAINALQSGDQRQPGIFLDMQLRLGDTTRACENKLFPHVSV